MTQRASPPLVGADDDTAPGELDADLAVQRGTSPPDPLSTLDEDYGGAVVHLAWDRNSKTGTRTLVFAFVELLPCEVPPPDDDYDPRSGRRLLGSSDHYVHVRHAALTAREAIAWYLACRDGHAALPRHASDPPQAALRRLVVERLGEDPPWPRLVTWSAGQVPFVPHWMSSPRLHMLVPVPALACDALWPTQRERDAAFDHLSRALHFPLAEYPELLGSVSLVAPNPIYRKHSSRLLRGREQESQLVRFSPRAGKSVHGLRLRMQERRPWGPVIAHSLEVGNELLLLPYSQTLHSTRPEVLDPQRGLLESSDNAHAFLRAISTRIGFVQTVRVQGETEQDSYTVQRGDFEMEMVVGEKRPQSAYSVLIGAHYARRSRPASDEFVERLFAGQKQEARAFLRSLLHPARHGVWFVDAYFAGTELAPFLPAIADTKVAIRILSSAQHLRTQDEHATLYADSLAKGLASVQPQLGNQMEVRVMTGRRPEVHDRFLVVDDRVYSVGCSLNELGQRGTMVIQVRESAPVLEFLHEVWDRSTSFQEWHRPRPGALERQER